MRPVHAIALALTLGAAACSPKTEQRGNVPLPHQLDQVAVGQSTMSDVANAFGTPSTVGTFDSLVWYYIGHRSEQWAFLEKEVTEAQVLALYFDENRVLERMETYTEEDMAEVALSDRETPTAGNELSFIEQMLGNFGRF